MLDSTAKTQPNWIHRIRWTELDGAEKEKARVSVPNLDVDELEALGHEALSVAAEWRKEIAERIPTPPTYKVFTFRWYYGGDRKIATWVEQPWALVRVGKGTSIAFLVKAQNALGPYPSYQAWIVSAARATDGGLRWKCRFESPSAIDRRDLVHVFPFSLPNSPSLGDLEQARAEARAKSAAIQIKEQNP